MRSAFIIDAVRTPRARRKGKFSSVHPVDLGTYPLNALIQRNKIPPDQIEDFACGVVTQTGEQGWCVARKIVLAAGWPHTVPATTINRICGSGQQATNFIAASIMAGTYDLAVAGGLEHMTRAQMFSDIGGEASPMLTKLYPDLVDQGPAADLLSTEFKISRNQNDEYAYQSQMRAKAARDEGKFKKSLISVPYKDELGKELSLLEDDTIRVETTIDTLSQLKPAFGPKGVITAGNASAIVDGAAAILLAGEDSAKTLKLKPRARIVSMAPVGSPPRIMLTGPIAASQLALKKAGLKISDIDLWEINEAFAPVPLVVMQELKLDPAKVNVNGGGIALGHPLGATGAMLIGTALDELELRNKRYALITMCIGLGMAVATIIERI